jgi:hypothetical protein
LCGFCGEKFCFSDEKAVFSLTRRGKTVSIEGSGEFFARRGRRRLSFVVERSAENAPSTEPAIVPDERFPAAPYRRFSRLYINKDKTTPDDASKKLANRRTYFPKRIEAG